MGFKEEISRVTNALPNCLAVTLMGRDGISVESQVSPSNTFDVSAYFVELTAAFSQCEKSSEQLTTGEVSEMVVRTEGLDVVMRAVGSEYFVALALPPHANISKGRYLLRVIAPRLRAELGA